MKQETIIIKPSECETRIDSVLASRFPDLSRSYFQYLIDKGFVSKETAAVKKRNKFIEGSKITVSFAPSEPLGLDPEKLKLDILYEDDAIIAINKERGVVVHPGAGNRTGTLVAGLLHYLGSLPVDDDPLRPGIVHRLDKETTGVIIIAKTREVHAKLVNSFKEREVNKTYVAITHSRPVQSQVNAPIGRHPRRREMMTIRPIEGKEAVTNLEVLHYDHQNAYVIVKPITGRTHQIRVHLKSISTPIVGDIVYGRAQEKDIPLCLHAHEISFTHPISQKIITITAPIPEHIKAWKKKLMPLIVS